VQEHQVNWAAVVESLLACGICKWRVAQPASIHMQCKNVFLKMRLFQGMMMQGIPPKPMTHECTGREKEIVIFGIIAISMIPRGKSLILF
jgi:hypothetical protein